MGHVMPCHATTRQNAMGPEAEGPNAVSLQHSLVVFVLTAWRLQESLRVHIEAMGRLAQDRSLALVCMI